MSEVLELISRSKFELQSILQSVVDTASQLCRADVSVIFRLEGGVYRFAAGYSLDPAYLEHERRTPISPGPGTIVGRAAMSREVVQIEDAWTDPLYEQKAAVKISGGHSMIGVPLMREGEPIGVIGLARTRVDPFTQREIDLVTTFADQAVIAIENARLLNELRQSEERYELVGEAVLENIYEWDIETNLLWASPRAIELFGLPGPELSAADFNKLVHPEDFPHYRAALRDCFKGITARLDCEYRVRHSDGKYRWLEDRGVPVRNAAGRAVRLVGAQSDVTERKQGEQALREALEQQTATSEVLRVISSSPGDLKPVFDAMLANAARLCEAKFGALGLREGDAYRIVAIHNAPQAFAEFMQREPLRPDPNGTLGRAIATKRIAQTADITIERPYLQGDPLAVAAVEHGGYRTVLAVPMLKESEIIGLIVFVRQEVRPFNDKQIGLLENFASQAVIAIENTRLLNELRQRTDDLTESLEQQTATSAVLRVISSSPTDIQPVLEIIGERAEELCNAEISSVEIVDGELICLASVHGLTEAGVEAARRAYPQRRTDETVTARAVRTRSVCHVADVLSDPQYQLKDTARIAGYRGCLAVPMVRDEQVVGSIFVARRQPGLFSETQVQLLRTFADQAVIAIENVRLFKETKTSLEQQTATADVLKIISRSTFDLRTVLQTLLESAARFCNADKANIIREKGGVFYAAEAYGYSRDFLEYMKNIPIKAERGSASGRALVEGRVVHIIDVAADPEYTLVEVARLGDFRTILCVPMLREGVSIGLLILTRSEVQAFTDEQIELVTTFADQAAIAIENVRLFEAEQQRTRELAESLEDLRTTQDRLVQTQKLASLGQLTAGIAHEIKNPLNFVNNFSGVSAELIDELQEALNRVKVDANTRAEITELTNTLRDNLDKIVQHGKRADAIVKNMLLHSREGSGEHRPVDVNALVEESLNLAYHGARAEKQGFKITMERSFDPAAGEIDVFPQEITRALLNLISNGFYAATKRKEQNDSDGYEPTLTASTKNLGDRVEIRIRDNGTGVSPEVREKMFNPFFTTKPAGEGTGLGLSISHDIIVKQHAGSIEVDTLPGEFTEVRIILPRTATFITDIRGRT